MISEKEGRFIIEGPMTIETAAALLEAGEPLVATADCTLDLAAVTAVDSAALAVVLGYFRSAQAAGRALTVINQPQAFRSLATLYGIDEILSDATKINESAVLAAHP
ncbi:MAG TPA: STAS domain-containing protein [Rhodocyclaceae bacterium]|nr:STAS domain-containing protein [Rhodocyclaceae bacterium]